VGFPKEKMVYVVVKAGKRNIISGVDPEYG
jgi:hypothetical protein